VNRWTACLRRDANLVLFYPSVQVLLRVVDAVAHHDTRELLRDVSAKGALCKAQVLGRMLGAE
jgi:hypothetical protein